VKLLIVLINIVFSHLRQLLLETPAISVHKQKI